MRGVLGTVVLWASLVSLLLVHWPNNRQLTTSGQNVKILSEGENRGESALHFLKEVRSTSTVEVALPLLSIPLGDHHTAHCSSVGDDDDGLAPAAVTCTVVRTTTAANESSHWDAPLPPPNASVPWSSKTGHDWLRMVTAPWLSTPAAGTTRRRTTGVGSWLDTLLTLLAIALFVLFCGRVVSWIVVSTAFGSRLRQRLASAPAYIVIRSVAFSSAGLVLCFDGTMQHMAVGLTLCSHLVYRWALWYWRESHIIGGGEQMAMLQAEHLTDAAFYASYIIAALGYTYVFQWSLLGIWAVFGTYSLVSTVRQYRMPAVIIIMKSAKSAVVSKLQPPPPPRPVPVMHTGPAHRYWSALETVVPVTCAATLFLFLLPRGGSLTRLLAAMVVPLTIWCPLFFLLLLVAHANFRHRRWSYVSVQCAVLFFIGLVWATVIYHRSETYSWHLLFLVLFCYAKLLDAYSRFDLEWLHWTMSLLCCAIGTWYARRFVV